MESGGQAPAAYVSQANWDRDDADREKVLPGYHCSSENLVQPDGTPIICSSESLFYYQYHQHGLNKTCPACDLASRIRRVAKVHKPPFFVLTYGGLWAGGDIPGSTGSKISPLEEFFTLLKDTEARLGDDFEVVGAQEMARLSRAASVSF